MMHEKMRRGDRGVILIVIVGVLAVLSLLAATFGMIARLEMAVSRNQTEYEMAREAAHAGSEYLLSALQSWLNGGTMTSGAVPDFLPNTADTDGQLLYKRDGVKVYMAVSPTGQTGSAKPDWLLGLGIQDAGMFNINAMGFAEDLGSNCNPDIRYTSFDCSLVRMLTSRFDPASTDAPAMTGSDIQNINLNRPGYPSFGDTTNPIVNDTQAYRNERQRVAILLSRAIINWRHGPDGVPGTAGTEERRLGHLPRWSNKLGVTAAGGVNTGVGYPGPTNNKFEWGYDDSFPNPPFALCPNYELADLLITVPALLGPPPWVEAWSYSEPGIWNSYLGNGVWGNDLGLPTPGLFWGKMSIATASTPIRVYADITQPGWRDWPVNLWQNDYIYIATGPFKWTWAVITSNDASSLSFAVPLLPLTGPSLSPNPNPGDAFCICPSAPPGGVYPLTGYVGGVGVLNKRWSTTDLNAEGDLVPNAMYWPNGALATEGNVLDLLVDNNSLLPAGAYGTVANTGTCTQVVLPNDPSLYDATQNWSPHVCLGKNYVVHIYAGTGRGQVRTIQDNINTQLTLFNPLTGNPAYWTAGNTPDTTSQYRIELSDSNLPSKFQPNNLQGDDRLYLSLGDLRDSVIVPALVSDGLVTANAQATADILLPYFLPYLSVSTQAIQASQSLCSINDWAVDGVDNDGNGIVDDNAQGAAGSTTLTEPQFEATTKQGDTANNREMHLAPVLYNKLGLAAWAHASASVATTTTRVQQAAQLVANIIDFRDPTDVPTKLTNVNLNETAATIPSFTVYGAKGLHVTQVMPSPDSIYGTSLPGTNEMTNDGGTGTQPALNDLAAWDWRDHGNPAPPPPNQNLAPWPPQPAWMVMDNTNPTATFTFSNLMPGYYAMRFIGTTGASFTVTYPPTTDTFTGTPYYVSTALPDLEAPANWGTGFVRKLPIGPTSNPLACFNVAASGPTAGQLSFQVQTSGGMGTCFRGFALCAQYIQFTNIATHDIRLDGMTVTTDQTQVVTTGPGVIPWQVSGNYLRVAAPGWPAEGTTPIDLRRIPGAAVGTPGILASKAAATATYPINYGTYVICMSEESYERQWSAQNGDPDYSPIAPAFTNTANSPSIDGDGIWGDAPNEAYPIYPFGDLSTDAQTMALLMGAKGTATAYAPSVIVKDAFGNLIAGAGPATAGVSYVDGTMPPMNTTIVDTTRNDVLSCYSAIEKTVILQPTWDTAINPGYWAPYLTPVAGSIPTTSTPAALAASQNTLVVAQDDAPRVPAGGSVSFRACLNRNYGYIPGSTTPPIILPCYTAVWDPSAAPIWQSAAPAWPPAVGWYTAQRWATLAKPSYMASQNRVFPFILNRPYATTGWLGLVPTSNTDLLNQSNPPPVTPPPPTGYVIPNGSWRTIDPNPFPSAITGAAVQPYPPCYPEQLLGALMSNATVGGVYARFNVNTAPVDTLKAVFTDAAANLIVATRANRQQGTLWLPLPPLAGTVPEISSASWANWDEFLNDPLCQNVIVGQITGYGAGTITAEGFRTWVAGSLSNMVITLTSGASKGQCALIATNTGNTLTLLNVFNPTSQTWPAPPWLSNFNPAPGDSYQIGIGFYDDIASNISNADAGAGTYADGFPDSSNEKKEWFMRYSNLFCLQSTSFQFTVAGLVYKDQSWDSAAMQNNEPVAMVRIEVNVDLSNQSGPSIVHFRYLTQQ